MTEAEKKLWWALRHRLILEGTHFRRQVSIGPYIADFCCHSAKLIIEADGGQHYTDDGAEQDATRTPFLEAQGFDVLRFPNVMIYDNIDSVVETFFARLQAKNLIDG